MSPIHEDLSKPQSSGTTYKNNLTSNGQQAACNEVSHSINRPNPKTSVNIVVQPLNHQRQSRQILNCVRGCTNTRNRETVLLRNAKIKKERENIANVEYENPRRALQHGMMSVMNACQSSRAQKENGEHHHVRCQDRNLRNEATPDGEHVQTRSASNHSVIINCRKIMNKRNVYGETKLHEAALKGDVDLLRALIQAGANVNLVDYAGWTALHEASVAGFHEAVGLLLSAGAHVDCKGLNGVTPLQDAVKGGHFEVVRLLLQHGADPFEKNELGECALQETMEIQMKRLIRSRLQGRAVAAKVGANSNISNSNSFKNSMDSKKLEESRNSKMAAMSDRTLTVKRKTGNTHQAESHVESNKNTQNTVATSNIIENQVTSVDVRQPQRSVTTRHMLKLQSQLSSHPEQQITQCNSLNNKSQAAGRDEIQNVASSVAMKEIMTKPISCTSDSVVVPDGTTEADIAMRRSTRIRNSMCGLSDQMEKTSTKSKQPSAENLQQNILTLKPCMAVRKNTTKATLNWKEKIKMEKRTSQESRNSKMAAMSDRALTLKRKTENTHQAERHMEFNKNTQNTVATNNIIENQATSVDVRQPQRSVTTRHMLKLRSQLSSHPEQQITQCNSLNNKSQAAGRDEIQNLI
ncbi:uncharacterized protein [Chiloscyllium punctatum]|uniref:uncharacterized protein n=1 Tax=Chiloscyllium punctatum TaxID=137246 RepID=UPI003B6396F8